MPSRSDLIMSETTAAVILLGVVILATFFCVRELLSAWRTGSIRSKVGLVSKRTDIVTFRRLFGVEALLAVLLSFFLLAIITDITRRSFGIDGLRVGVALTTIGLLVLLALAAKFRRQG